MTVRLSLILLMLLLPSGAFSSGEFDGKLYFKAGLEAYGRGDYSEAVRNFTSAHLMLKQLGDYALLYAARSYLHSGETAEAVYSVRMLYREYPSSPLVMDARSTEVVALMQAEDPAALGLLESYVDDYPLDAEMKFILAGMLKASGRVHEAKELFRALYVEAGPLSEDAYAELEPGDLAVEDLLRRAAGLIRNREYGEAEAVLKTALDGSGDDIRRDIQEKLALTLFRQRKYDEASGVFLEVGDLYNAARSFIRSGSQEAFDETLGELIRRRDRKGADLMLAYAGELRRQGKVDEALRLLERVKSTYPKRAEDALWGKGWTLYMSGDYKGAKRAFKRLYSRYRTPSRNKYLYWRARATERTGGDAARLYGRIRGEGFYAILAGLRTDTLELEDNEVGFEPLRRKDRPRVDILVEMGLREEAVNELMLLAESDSTYPSLLDIAVRLVDLEEYKKAMLVISTLPQSMRPAEVLYPHAFWSKINEIAPKYGIDPYLLLSLIREESRFDPEVSSPAGAIGLMQLMPSTATHTAKGLKLRVNGKESLRDVELNIMLGTHYLNGLLNQFNSVSAALAAYNAGEHRVERWLSSNDYSSYDEFIEDIPFTETRNYVKRIVSTYFRYQRAGQRGYNGKLKIL